MRYTCGAAAEGDIFGKEANKMLGQHGWPPGYRRRRPVCRIPALRQQENAGILYVIDERVGAISFVAPGEPIPPLPPRFRFPRPRLGLPGRPAGLGSPPGKSTRQSRHSVGKITKHGKRSDNGLRESSFLIAEVICAFFWLLPPEIYSL